jgi:hypothetical protein
VFANGQRFEGNNYTMDDTNTNGEARNGVTNIVPNSEAVEEVRITANNFSAVDGAIPALRSRCSRAAAPTNSTARAPTTS